MKYNFHSVIEQGSTLDTRSLDIIGWLKRINDRIFLKSVGT